MVNMRGGVGYWNQDGELVLDVHPNDDDFDESDYLDEEEYDSNSEDCDVNDYPEDDFDFMDDDDRDFHGIDCFQVYFL